MNAPHPIITWTADDTRGAILLQNAQGADIGVLESSADFVIGRLHEQRWRLRKFTRRRARFEIYTDAHPPELVAVLRAAWLGAWTLHLSQRYRFNPRSRIWRDAGGDIILRAQHRDLHLIGAAVDLPLLILLTVYHDADQAGKISIIA